MLKLNSLLKLNSHHTNAKFVRSFYSVPEKFRNAFFLANASLFDYTNWYIHKAYETCFRNIVQLVETNSSGLDANQARSKVMNVIEMLEPCNGVIDISFPVKKTDGLYEVVTGYRAMHALNLYDTPCLGGMRMCTDLKKDHIRAFSILSTYKHACFGIDMAGAHGGLKLCGHSYQPDDLKNIIVSYGRELARRGFLGCQVDILEPDLYCSSREMEWIADEFLRVDDSLGLACAVGKPVEKGGIEMYDKALPYGIICALNLFMANEKITEKIEWEGTLKDKTFIIQGLGNIGSQLSEMLLEAGATCVGVKEHDSAIYMEDGVPIKELIDYKNDTGSILEFNKYTKPVHSDQIYTEPCDILILAATHRSLQCHVADRVKAKIVIEAAYSSMTPSAYKVLTTRRRLVLPDIFAGAGASIASYLEYIKNINDSPLNILISRVANLAITSANSEKLFVMDAENLRLAIDSMMKTAYDNIMNRMELYELGLDVRTAAYTVAIETIFTKICQMNRF